MADCPQTFDGDYGALPLQKSVGAKALTAYSDADGVISEKAKRPPISRIDTDKHPRMTIDHYANSLSERPG